MATLSSKATPTGGMMGLQIRKRLRLGRSTSLNLSKAGVSVSKKFGPITINSSGHVTLRILPGVTWRLK